MPNFKGGKRVVKIWKRIFWIAPLALLIAGCAAPESGDAIYAEWRQQELLPPTGSATSQVYSESKPAVIEPRIVVQTDQGGNFVDDLALAEAIRQDVKENRGLAPSLRGVTIEVRDGHVILQGSVKSDLDARVIMDDLRDVPGVTHIANNLEINPHTD
jgi:osmotically-inducible protein OsmY